MSWLRKYPAWHNLPATTTAIDEVSLNNIYDGIDEGIAQAASASMTAQNVAASIPSGLIPPPGTPVGYVPSLQSDGSIGWVPEASGSAGVSAVNGGDGLIDFTGSGVAAGGDGLIDLNGSNVVNGGDGLIDTAAGGGSGVGPVVIPVVGAPSTAVGRVGDYAWDVTTGAVYGPKT